MNTVREYRMPLLIGAGALVVALIVWAVLVAPQSSKLSSLQAQETQLQTQQTALQAKLAALKTEKQNLTKSCADLAEDRHADPQRAEPDRRRCRGVVVREPVQWSGRDVRGDLDPVQRIRPGHDGVGCTRRHAGTVDDGLAGRRRCRADHLAVTGNYSQDDRLHQRAGQLPPPVRDPEVRPDLRQPAAPHLDRRVRARRRLPPPLWPATARPCGSAERRPSPTAGPYSLSINGSIYYTSTPNALAACTKATATVH